MIIAPWSTHLSITFLFSGSDGVSFGPPGISTCVIHYTALYAIRVQLVDVCDLLIGIVYRMDHGS